MKMKKIAALFLTAALLTGCSSSNTLAPDSIQTTEEGTTKAAEASADESGKNTGIVDGTYTQTASGNNGDVKVEVEVLDGVIKKVEVIEHMETAGISDKAISDIPSFIVENQSLGIDAISGATNTSNAILEAAQACLSEAGFDVGALKQKKVETTAQKQEDTSCDTVVIGAGGAGMKVSLALSEGGQDVILVEKMPMVGGATSFAATYFVAVDTTFHRENGISLTIEDYVKRTKERDPNINEVNLKNLLDHSQESLDWLNAMGTKINRPISDYQVATEDGTSLGVAIVKAMSTALDKSTVDVRLNTEAMELLMDGNRASGVKVKDSAGEYTITADQVVVASGGFVSGEEAVKKYAPDWSGLPSTSAAGSTGEMFERVEAVGGVLSNMDNVRLNPSVHSENGVNSSLSAARAEGGIMVNQKGQRFCNDYYPDYTVLSRWMMEQEGDYVYILIDQTAMDKSKRLQSFKDKGYFMEADTVEKLAEKMKVPVENLMDTIAKYQKAVETGTDEEFGRTANLSIDFKNPPYYAVQTKPGLQVSLGGILIDETMRIVKEDGTCFDNLYAVGECADDGLFGAAPTNIDITFGKEVAEHILNK
ncbi:MAG: FAD-dependent oxidoreductase [Lachnospiraceae bacterium]|nr:FAD-dependent oxidoreductase [Lachnospiraceae bacterium]